MYPKVRISDKIVYDAPVATGVYQLSGTSRQNVQIGMNERNDIFRDRAGHMQSMDFTYTIDPKDVPDPTKKQQTLFDGTEYGVLTNSKLSGTVESQNRSSSYNNERNTLNYEYKGIIGTDQRQGRAYDQKMSRENNQT